VAVPANINLDLAKYLNNRGVKPLNFQPQAEFKDPFGNQDKLTPRASMGFPTGAAPAPAKPGEAKGGAPVKPEEKK
jgi:hypothetical protein